MKDYEKIQYRLQGIVTDLKKTETSAEFRMRPIGIYNAKDDSGLLVLPGHCIKPTEKGMRRISKDLHLKPDTLFLYEDVKDERLMNDKVITLLIGEDDCQIAESGKIKIQGFFE